jgi:hypothetical protein
VRYSGRYCWRTSIFIPLEYEAMKTAKIRVNHIFGTKNDYCADVFYRGKLLASFDKRVLDLSVSQLDGLLNWARTWALRNGFTHIDYTFG